MHQGIFEEDLVGTNHVRASTYVFIVSECASKEYFSVIQGVLDPDSPIGKVIALATA